MRITRLLIPLCLIAFAFQSCEKNADECSFLAPQMIFSHFSESDLDTIIIRKYEKNSLFNHIIDTARVTKANIGKTLVGADSLLVDAHNTSFSTQLYQYDWELVFPSINRKVRILNVEARFNQSDEAGAECHSFVTGMTFDGMSLLYNDWLPSGYKAYVER